MSDITTSRAKQVSVDLFNYDSTNFALTYTSLGVPINLTNYSMRFILEDTNGLKICDYVLPQSVNGTFLVRSGASMNILDMSLMFKDIRDVKVKVPKMCRLVQVVTDPDGNVFVHVVYNINIARY